LATVGPGARPHLVPVTFALAADTVVSAVDAKPKSTRRLRRLANIEANPAVCLLADHYSDDWDTLWWVRADGHAAVHATAPARVAELLADKYRQYREQPPEGPFVVVRVETWRGWSAR
ncbi:MAG TPA: TIGR03668 family PPOX class F420-dependent oxidoreductase, partial [Pseudonocardiaceae bacterium]